MTTAEGLAGIQALTGVVLGPTDWHEVTQPQVNTFADATGDHQWIHVDPVRPAAGPFGGPIAHGYLTLSLIIPLWTDLLTLDGIRMGVNYGLNKVRFPAPVPVGGKVRLAATISEVTHLDPASIQATIDFTMELDGSSKPAVVAQALYRYYA